jgi:hypothetical protein
MEIVEYSCPGELMEPSTGCVLLLFEPVKDVNGGASQDAAFDGVGVNFDFLCLQNLSMTSVRTQIPEEYGGIV